MKLSSSVDPEALGRHLATDIRAVARHRARIEAILREIENASETEGREKFLSLYQGLPQVRVLAATYAVPPDEIEKATRDSTLTEDERKEFLVLISRLGGLEKTRLRLKDALPDLFQARLLRRSPLNLVLEIDQLNGKRFRARLSGEGVATERTFELDPAILKEAELIQQAAENQEPLPPYTAENLGRRLGSCVLGLDAVEAIRLAISEDRRVRIFLPPTTTALLPVPWEALLRGSELAQLLPNVIVVRGTPASTAVPLSLPPLPPLRVLLILSSPLDLDPRQEIQVEHEREMVMEPLRSLIAQGQVRLKVLDVASRRRIREALSEGFHVVHFIGHGTEGGLLIEDEVGNSQAIRASDFAALFTEGRPIMVWLTACRSAANPQNDLHGSVAEALTGIRVPAVVAMRYSLTYDAGRRLGEAFYQALIDGKGPEEALESARNAVFLGDVDHIWADWTIPALFSHSPREASFEWQENVQPTPREDWLSGLNRLDQGFVGRRGKIREIKDALTIKGKRVVVIQGLPGVGKSVLASRVIEDLRDDFDGIFSRTVLRDEETGRPNLDFLGFLRELDYFLRRYNVSALSGAVAHEEWPVQLKLQHLHEALQARRFLIVLDSAEDLLDSSFRFEDWALEEMFKELLATGPRSRFLLTTRKGPVFPEEERFAERIEVVPLPELNEQEALELVSLRKEVRLPRDDLRKMLDRAQGIPLALASYLSLAREPDRLREVLASPLKAAPDPASRAIAELVGQLPESLRQAGARAALFRTPTDREALKAAGLTPTQVDGLKDWSLLLHIRDADLYTMHPHVRLHLTGFLSEDERNQTHSAIAAYLERFRQRFAEEYKEAEKDPARSRAWLARALHLAPSGSTVDIALEEHYHRRASGDEEGAGTLLEEIAQHLFTTGRLRELDRLIQETPEPILGCKIRLRVWQARVWQTWGRWDEATQLLEAIRSDLSADPEVKAAVAFDIATIAQDRGDYEGAKASYHQLLDAYPDNNQVKSASYHEIGIIHHFRGDYAQALEWYQKSLAIKERLGDLAGIASSYHQIGMIYQDRGDYAAALEWYQKSLAIKERLGDLAGVATSYGQIGIIHHHRGDYAAALERYQKSLALLEQLGDLARIAKSYHQIGMVHQDRGDYAQALEWYQKSLAISERLGDLAGIASSYHQIGTVHQLQGDYATALEQYQKSLVLLERLENLAGIATSYHQIGMIHQKQGDYAAALEWYQKSLAIEERLGDLAGTAASYHQIGMIHQRRGDYAAALEWYQKSLALFERLGDLAGIASSLGQIGLLHAARREFKVAIRATHTAALIFERIGSPGVEKTKAVMVEIIHEVGEEEFKKLLTEVLGQQTKEETTLD